MSLREIASRAMYSLIVLAFGCVLALLVWPFLIFWFPNLAN
jgi:uncharacterized RDD family membrane protein YckC